MLQNETHWLDKRQFDTYNKNMIIRRKPPEHICGKCGYYIAFYIKKETCFERLKDGYCNQCEKIKEGNETCGQWKTRYERDSSKWKCTPIFKELIFHLTAIKTLIK